MIGDPDFEVDHAELEWQRWRHGSDLLALSMLPLMRCIRNTTPENIEGLSRHLRAMFEAVNGGECTLMTGSSFCAFLRA